MRISHWISDVCSSDLVSEACGYTRNFTAITEHVCARLARQISNDQVNHDGFIPMITLSAQWEQAFAEAIVGDGEERQLSMAPTRLQEFINAVRQTFERHALLGERPVLLTSPPVRTFVRSDVERFRPPQGGLDRKRVGEGQSVYVSFDTGGPRL